MYDGFPLVHLHDDPKEIHDLLQTFYDSRSVSKIPPIHLCIIDSYYSYLPFLPLDTNTTAKLIAPLELATKYEVDHLRSRIIAQLELEWPSTLGSWEKLNAVDRPKPEPVIRLARDYGVPTVLLAAFYQLSTSSTSDMDLAFLRTEDIFAVLAGRERMQAYLSARFPYVDDPYWMAYDTFLTLGCKKCRIEVFWSTFLPKLFHSRDPMKVLHDLIQSIETQEYITCKECRDDAYLGFEKEYKLLFAELPRFFGLA